MKRWMAVVGAAVVLLAVGLKIWGWQSDRARIAERDRALAAIKGELKTLGGKIEVDAASPGKPVIGLDLSGTSVTNEDLARIPRLTSLRKLDLSNTHISDTGAEFLEGMVSLRTLDLQSTQISYAKYKKLKQKLKKAKIDVGLTAAELQRDAKQAQAIFEIRQLGGKVELDTSKSEKPVIAVDLSSTRISDADLARLKAFPLLQKLQLGGTHITDEGLTRLKGFSHLETLLLGGTLVTDAGLPHLTALPGLKHVFLVETRVTHIGIRELQEKLPNTRIDRWQ